MRAGALALLIGLFSAVLSASPAAVPVSAPVRRGAYLAAAAGCARCHTDKRHGGKPYAGGRRISTPFGIVVTPNITPDRKYGIGGWGRADFVQAMRWGIAPDDSHYLPAFPFYFYSRLSSRDLSDLRAFLASLPPVAAAPRAGDSLLPFARTRAAITTAAESFPGPWRPDPRRSAVWNRGAYLVATVGRCGDCHTPRTLLGAPDRSRALAGAFSGPDGRKVPNLTPDLATGLGKWTEGDIVTLLGDGQTPSFDFVGGAMAQIVEGTSRLTEADRRAIAVYLRSLPPIPLRRND